MRFNEIELQLHALAEYVTLLDTNLPKIVEAERDRVRREHSDDQDEGTVADHLESRLDSGLATSLLMSSAVVAVWAQYELVVSELAKRIARQKEISLRLCDLRGSFMERARKYFDDVLRFDLHPIETDWDTLGLLADVRHAIAHANGQLEDMQQAERARLERRLARTPTLTVVDGCLVVSPEFAREASDTVSRLLRDLMRRMENEKL